MPVNQRRKGHEAARKVGMVRALALGSCDGRRLLLLLLLLLLLWRGNWDGVGFTVGVATRALDAVDAVDAVIRGQARPRKKHRARSPFARLGSSGFE
jgi:hypothetical protein